MGFPCDFYGMLMYADGTPVRFSRASLWDSHDVFLIWIPVGFPWYFHGIPKRFLLDFHKISLSLWLYSASKGGKTLWIQENAFPCFSTRNWSKPPLIHSDPLKPHDHFGSCRPSSLAVQLSRPAWKPDIMPTTNQYWWIMSTTNKQKHPTSEAVSHHKAVTHHNIRQQYMQW